MARNIEIKAAVPDPGRLHALVALVADSGPVELHQTDTFFHSGSGRLKLREFSDGDAELIYYERADGHAPEESFYLLTPIPDPGPLRESLARTNGIAGVVSKIRQLYLRGRTRIHLDEVTGLGHFVELEVVLAGDEPSESGRREATDLMSRLSILPEHLIDKAYIDLILERMS